MITVWGFGIDWSFLMLVWVADPVAGVTGSFINDVDPCDLIVDAVTGWLFFSELSWVVFEVNLLTPELLSKFVAVETIETTVIGDRAKSVPEVEPVDEVLAPERGKEIKEIEFPAFVDTWRLLSVLTLELGVIRANCEEADAISEADKNE